MVTGTIGSVKLRYNPRVLVVETERLSLRRLELRDAAFILELLNDAEFLRFIGDKGVRTLEDARRYLVNGPLASYEQYGFGLYLVSIKENGSSIGICGILKRDSLPDPDIGFALLPRYWSKGYAFEAASAVMEHGRKDLGLARIVAITAPENEASMRLLRKLGMKYEASLRLEEDRPEVRLFASDPP